MRISSLFIVCLWAALSQAALIVNTQYGPVAGKTSSTTKMWLGMRYTAPVSGAGRFRPPSPPTPWTEPADATQFGFACPQSTPTPNITQNEDCLNINVWAPINSNAGSNLPVYFYIYGGQNTLGYPNRLEGSFMAGQDIVVVVASYRLGALGFLSHDALRSLNPEGTTGNYGIQDQRAALRWIQNNIANFGGNPNNVAIGGTSAGGGAVCAHFVSPHSAGLFNKIIVQSGFCVDEYLTVPVGTSRSAAIISGVGCTQTNQEELLNCLLTTAPAAYLGKTSGISPTMEAYETPEFLQPVDKIRAGLYTPLPMIIGNNANESSASYCSAAQAGMSEAQYRSTIQTQFPNNYEEVLEVYTLDKYPTPAAAVIAAASDSRFDCNSKQLDDAVAQDGNDVWVFRFDRAPAATAAGANRDCLGASHMFEVGFFFPAHLSGRTGGGVWTPEEQVLANNMRAAWVQFIKTGTPSFPGLAWPKYTYEEGKFAILDLDIKIGAQFKNKECPVFGVPSTSTECEDSLTFAQNKVNSWESNGVSYSQWSVSVTTGDLPLYSAEIEIQLPYGSSIQNAWGVVRNSYGWYILQDSRLQSGQSVPSHTTLTFGYIASSANAAVISIGVAECNPAPQPPKDCSVTATLNTQSVYYDGTRHFKVYNFAFTNVGNANTNTLQIKLNLPAGSYPTQAWNLATTETTAQIQQSGTVTYTASLFGLAPGNTGYSSGYILTSPTPIVVDPTFSVLSYVCQ